ncbi:hypothetical protein ABRP83_13485 [Pectobacterium brasiliense]|uniref:hypothetical protein n=1 Tax=Pectobacterium brasiliense TaxID=180957 RepID=UPI0032F09AE4
MMMVIEFILNPFGLQVCLFLILGAVLIRMALLGTCLIAALVLAAKGVKNLAGEANSLAGTMDGAVALIDTPMMGWVFLATALLGALLFCYQLHLLGER